MLKFYVDDESRSLRRGGRECQYGDFSLIGHRSPVDNERAVYIAYACAILLLHDMASSRVCCCHRYRRPTAGELSLAYVCVFSLENY